MSDLRIGYGEDAHALAAGRPLVVGGVEVPASPVGAVAHSDGDVLLHALSDALLSAAALGDIGTYFPPSDEQFKDMDSSSILSYVLELLNEQGRVTLHNVAAVVTLDAPKLGKLRDKIQSNVVATLGTRVQSGRHHLQDERGVSAGAHSGSSYGAAELGAFKLANRKRR